MTADTIVAQSTAPGESALTVIRLSGPRSLELSLIFITKKKLAPRKAELTWFKASEGIKDRCIAILFPKDSSYTGENMVEISLHGNPLLTKIILRDIINAGARLAERGEFTKRAYLNGKLDLTQADAVLAMISAKTYSALKHASLSLQGKIKKKVKQVLDLLEITSVELEICIVNAEELSHSFSDKFEKSKIILNELKNWSDQTSDDFKIPEVIILGPANAGKSTLFNILLGEERVIVSTQPGTTRDFIRENLKLGELTVKLVDGAGFRGNNDTSIESKGYEMLLGKISDSKLLLLVFDINTNWKNDYELFSKLVKGKENIVVLNKTDLCKKSEETSDGVLRISAKKNINIDLLKEKIEKLLFTDKDDNAAYLSDRASKLCYLAYHSFNRAINSIEENLWDIAAIELKNVRNYLGEILGKWVSPGDLVKFFDRFCIGK